MKNFIDEIKDRILIYDGSKGYLLQRLGLSGGECPELWNIEHADKVREVYESYRDAGCDVIQTNTFQGSRIQLEKYSLGDKTYELNFEAARLAKEVMANRGYVAASIGPTGKLFEPYGDLTFEKAYQVYKEQIKALVDGGVDVINFETFTDLAEMRVAFLAARALTDIPVICSFAFESNGMTLMGTDPYTAALVMSSLGAEMVGTNCSFGPENMIGIVEKMYELGGICLSVKPNAGIPEVVDGEVTYAETAEGFSRFIEDFVKCGARLVGGCCGTTPEFIGALKESVGSIQVGEITAYKGSSLIASSRECLDVENIKISSMGEVNTENDKELLDELTRGNTDFVVDKAMDLSGENYDVICINVDKAGGEADLLSKVVCNTQAYVKKPFIIETKNPEALEAALRVYNGRAGVIIDNNYGENADTLINIADKYGSKVLKPF